MFFMERGQMEGTLKEGYSNPFHQVKITKRNLRRLKVVPEKERRDE